MSDDDEDDDDLNMAEFDDSSSDDDEDGPAFESMERKARKLQLKKRQMREDAAMEEKDAVKRAADDAKDAQAHGFEFPTAENLVKERELGVDMTYIKSRFEETLRILANFNEARDGIHTRKEYLDLLIHDLAFYYGYNDFLIGKFMQLFSPSECAEFVQANEAQRPLTIRVNTLKARRGDLIRNLAARGVDLKPIEWSNVAVQVFQSSVPIGATPEYLAGHYMLQSASSMTAVVALGALPDERVLDMCAAPGGKTTYIAQAMKNTGTLVANDVHPDRLKSLSANLHRLGVRNAIVTNYDGKEFPTVMGGFDRVLLDAPCTGTGVIARDASVKVSKGHDDIVKLGQTQRRLILAAIDSIDANSPTGGILVYATCSITVEENEAIVDYALRKRYIKVVDSGMEFGKPGIVNWRNHRFNDQVKLGRRYYPHVYNMDGFFICKIKKVQNGIRTKQDKKRKREDGEESSDDESMGSDDEFVFTGASNGEAKLSRKQRKLARQTTNETEEEAEFEEIDDESEESSSEEEAAPLPPKKKAKVAENTAVAKSANGKVAKKVAVKETAPAKEATPTKKEATPAKKSTPSKSAMAVDEPVEAPAAKVATPKKAATPAKKEATPAKKATPAKAAMVVDEPAEAPAAKVTPKKTATPAKKETTPAKKEATPTKKEATPAKKSTPSKAAVVAEEPVEAPAAKVATPKKAAATPTKKEATPAKAATPKAATPAPKAATPAAATPKTKKSETTTEAAQEATPSKVAKTATPSKAATPKATGTPKTKATSPKPSSASKKGKQ